jgi:hypothetical protein
MAAAKKKAEKPQTKKQPDPKPKGPDGLAELQAKADENAAKGFIGPFKED